jgi:hypothetical protein
MSKQNDNERRMIFVFQQNAFKIIEQRQLKEIKKILNEQTNKIRSNTNLYLSSNYISYT